MSNRVITDHKEHKPFIPASTILPELTPVPVIVGAILGIIFGASSLYLALKVGMTVSASIPVAVLSITLFRALSKVFKLRPATILENNITQTTGSAGEGLAFGIACTMPALLILGHEMEVTRTMLVAILGGMLGVLMMIPLRRALIVKEHGTLAYPEGTACAEVLIAGERGGSSAITVFGGFFFGLIYKILNLGLKLWNDVPEKAISWFKGAAVSAEVSPELLGVGYIIGPRIACITVAGGILSSWVLTPMIKLFGDNLTQPLYPATKLISQMSLGEIWHSYVLYIGAGAVATGGILSLIQSLPTIIRGARGGLSSIGKGGGRIVTALRTEHDLPPKFVFLGSLAIVVTIWFAPSLNMNLLGALLIVCFGFLFVTVSSRLTGEIGSSSNPISGMTVATLLLTSLVFLGLGWVSPMYRVVALSIAAIVCCAASNGGTISQDLKTGFLVGSSPRNQQIAMIIGSLTSALVIGATLNLLNDSATVYTTKNLPAATISSVDTLTETAKVNDPSYRSDDNTYHVLRVTEMATEGPLAKVPPGKYLIDNAGSFKYLVDPGVNGALSTRDNGQTVKKFEAPKARLMSLIIDGILSRKLPWGLVLLGAAIVVVLELCGVSALPFAVGVYLPLSTSMPIFFGGAMRWLVTRITEKRGQKLSAEEDESGPGILFSSGLIAGGSIAGIGLAIVAWRDWGSKFDIGASFPWLGESTVIPALVFAAMMGVLVAVALSKPAGVSKK